MGSQRLANLKRTRIYVGVSSIRLRDMKISQHAQFAQVLLSLTKKDDAPPTPSELGRWANDNAIVERTLARAEELDVDTSGVKALVAGADLEDLEDRLASWSNAIDTQRKYGLDSDGPYGWLALLWQFVDVVWEKTGDVDATWN